MTGDAMEGFQGLIAEKRESVLKIFPHLHDSPLLTPLACQAAENAALTKIMKAMSGRITALEEKLTRP